MPFSIPAHKNVDSPAGQIPAWSSAGLDFSYVDHGNVVILTAITVQAKQYADAFFPDEAAIGGSGPYSISKPDFPDIIDWLDEEGFTL